MYDIKSVDSIIKETATFVYKDLSLVYDMDPYGSILMVVYMHMDLLTSISVKDRLARQIIDELKTIISHSH
jgi:hypothetical protein